MFSQGKGEEGFHEFSIVNGDDDLFVEGEPDWEFFMPDEAPEPDPNDFWIEGDYDEAA